MRIRKTSQPSALPLDTAQVVDSYSTSTTDAYSCNQVNEMNTYSTDEIRVGTWINGKPVYRKVIISTSHSAQTNDISHGISNLEQIIYSYAVAWKPNQGGGVNYNYPVDNYTTYTLQLGSINETRVSVKQNGFGDWNIYIILEYTKTS